jgi:hypothetical protein
VELRVARMEVRIEHIERDIAEIKTAIRLIWAGIIGSSVGLAGLMAKGFGWL